MCSKSSNQARLLLENIIMKQLKLFAFKLFKHEVPDLNAVIEKRHAVPKLVKKKVHWLKEGLHKRHNDYNDGYHYGIYVIDTVDGSIRDQEWHKDQELRDMVFRNYYKDLREI